MFVADRTRPLIKQLADNMAFGTNDEITSGTVTYTGSEDSEGVWMVMKVDTSSGTTIRYATVRNNPSVTSYTDAWTNRATLTYNYYSIAF